MKVILSTSLCWAGYWYHSGDEVDLPNDVARVYIAAGSAERVTPPIETAALRTTAPKGKQDVRNTTTRQH